MQDRETNHPPSRLVEATQSFDQMDRLADPRVGQMVAHYHVLATVGAGAYGTVYRARDTRLDRTVALKFLRRGATEDFEQEARTLAALSEHPHIVTIHAWGVHEETPYLVLAYLPANGAALLEQEGPLRWQETLRLVGACARALAAAHDQGIVHGDIKPANILLDPASGSVCLADFGLATARGVAAGLRGSPAFLAPERLAGGPPTAACDIYALGMTLHMLLSGSFPFADTSVEGVMEAARCGDIIPLSATGKDFPPGLTRLVADMTAHNPDKRPPSMESVLKRLEDLEKPFEDRKMPAWSRRARRIVGALAAALVVVAALFFGDLPFGGGDSGAVVLADARLLLNQGDYAAARHGFEAYLEQQPDSAEARYGLAYAFLLEGDYAQAEEAFAHLGEAALREEGRAAVAYMSSGEGARPALEEAAGTQPGGYADVLLGTLDIMRGDFETARNRLDGVSEEQLRFDWQRREYLRTLGQLHFKAGEFEEAQAVFDRLAGMGETQHDDIANDYADLARRRLERVEREEVSAQVARLKTLLREQPAETPSDTWTSAPLRLWIPPVEVRKGQVARESGLADVLPWRVSRQLLAADASHITPVERELTAALLAEQELASQLGGEAGSLRLGRVLGARLVLDASVTTVFGEELLHLSLVDTETTRMTPVGEYALSRGTDAKAFLDQVVADIVRAVETAYPLRGRMTVDEEGPHLNIGRAVGLQEGTRFVAYAGPKRDVQLDGVRVVAEQVSGDARASVRLEGAAPEDIPASGWYVEAAPTASEGGHAAM
jgi:tetratricopeptide (TPR) repeat protein